MFENYHTSCAFVATDDHPTIQHIGQVSEGQVTSVRVATKVYTFLLQPAFTTIVLQPLRLGGGGVDFRTYYLTLP